MDSDSGEAESSRDSTTTPDWRFGKSMRNVAPRPSSLETEIVAVMVADDRLHDGQAQAGALLLRRVVRGEEARALFGRQAFAGVGNFDADGVFARRVLRRVSVPPAGMASSALRTRF